MPCVRSAQCSKCGKSDNFAVKCLAGKRSSQRLHFVDDLDQCSFEAHTIDAITHSISAVENMKSCPKQLFTTVLCTLRCPKGEVSKDVDFFVVDKEFRPLFGAQTCQKLNVIKEVVSDIVNSETVSSVNGKLKAPPSLLSKEWILKEYRDVFEGLGSDPLSTPNHRGSGNQTKQGKGVSVLDAKTGFWQVQLDKELSYFTTFNKPFGRFRWLHLPFGVRTAPAEYQRRMHGSLQSLNGIKDIVDDILCVGEDDTHESAVNDHDRN
ncbi:hypothetical protein ACROYT_G011549 [Oculina patagonica]